jgi:hypothetical protein
MVTSLEELHPFLKDSVNHSMFLGDSTRPTARQQKLQWFRFSNPTKRVTTDRFNQLKKSESNFAINFDPVS